MKGKLLRTATLLLITVLVSSITGYVNPAWACGCGAVVSNDPLRVAGEASIVRWDGSVEQIVMRLGVQSQAADAAWIFPTPTVASVALGDRGWFQQIDYQTRPEVRVKRDWWPRWGGAGGYGAAAPGGGSVNLLHQEQLGPFVVATLDATDAGALSTWLTTNGYRLSPDLGQSLDGYVKQGWKYVAVKLVPQAGPVLDGDLDPLHISFDSDRLVYPMYLSRLAKTSQHVHVWVVAAHRVQRVDPDASRIPTQVRFAGRVSGLNGSLRDFVGPDQWLTEFETWITQPARISSDWRFAYAGADAAHREVEVHYDSIYILGIPGGWFLVGLAVAGLALLLATVAIVVMLRRGNPAARLSR